MTCRFFGLLLLAAVGAGCHSNPPQDREPVPETKPIVLENVTWQLVDIGGKPAEPVATGDRAVSFRLDSNEKRASGYSGINQFNGTYQLNGQSLSFGPMAMTRRAGPAPLMQQESAFTQALTDTKSWRAAGADNIQLLDSGGKVLAKFTSR